MKTDSTKPWIQLYALTVILSTTSAFAEQGLRASGTELDSVAIRTTLGILPMKNTNGSEITSTFLRSKRRTCVLVTKILHMMETSQFTATSSIENNNILKK
jgi:hypothetical protein